MFTSKTCIALCISVAFWVTSSNAADLMAITYSQPNSNQTAQNPSSPDYFPPDRNSYDWICNHGRGEILYDSKNLTTALTLTPDDISVIALETLLVEVDISCNDCYFITSKFTNIRENFYSFHFRLNDHNAFIVDMTEYLGSDEYVPVVTNVPCVKNPDYSN